MNSRQWCTSKICQEADINRDQEHRPSWRECPRCLNGKLNAHHDARSPDYPISLSRSDAIKTYCVHCQSCSTCGTKGSDMEEIITPQTLAGLNRRTARASGDLTITVGALDTKAIREWMRASPPRARCITTPIDTPEPPRQWWSGDGLEMRLHWPRRVPKVWQCVHRVWIPSPREGGGTT